MKKWFTCWLWLVTLLAGCSESGSNSVVIHADSVCRFDPLTNRVYIVQRLYSDAILVLDCPGSENARALVVTSDYATGSFATVDQDLNLVPDGCLVAGEYSVGAGSNPQDIAVVASDLAYIPRLEDKHLLTVHPTEGTELSAIDLSSYADSDGVPEAAWAVVHDQKVYLTLQRLTNFEPSDYSSVLVIDGPTGEIEQELILAGTSPFAKMRFSKVLNRIVIGQNGTFGTLDGGVELLNPADRSLSGFVITEEELGGDVADVLIVSATKGYAVISQTQADFKRVTKVVSFDPATGQKLTDLLIGEGFDHSFLELTPDGSQLWVTDRNLNSPGLHVFDTSDDREITDGPVDTGLPPFMICFM